MIIKVDIREQELLNKINLLIANEQAFKDLTIITENLPLGDIIIIDEDGQELIVVERKTVNDLLSSIKDGRYEEQSYRLNGINHHNHNIIYLIEGDVTKTNKFQPHNKLTAYSAMFSLNYYKGFSVFRTFNIDETSIVICNMAYKLKQNKGIKLAHYINKIQNIDKSEDSNKSLKEQEQGQEQNQEHEQENNTNNYKNKNYVNVVKKVKKDNITTDNIDEIMLCQIPSISSVTASAIISKFTSIGEIIKQLEINNDCLKDISYINDKGQSRKISKTCILNIIKFLLKK